MRIPLRRRLALLPVLAVLCAGPSCADGAAYGDLVPLSLAVELSGKTEPLSVDDLIRAAVAFSGATADSGASLTRTLSRAVEDFRGKASGVTSPAERGEYALKYLHDAYLKTYSLNQMRVDVAMETGVFNCLSSSVLYVIFARAAGLSVTGVLTSDHAFCSVLMDGAIIDVETTNRYGFNPGTKKEFRDLFGKTTGYSYVPPSSYADRRNIGDKELLGCILHDRASYETDRGRYYEAVGPAVSAYALAPTPEFKETRTAILSNYASIQAMQGRAAESLAFLSEAESAFGPIPELENLKADVIHNRIGALIEAGKTEEAEKLLGAAPSAFGMDPGDWRELSVYAVQKRAESAFKAKGYEGAISVLTDGIARIGGDAMLLRIFESYVHNQFAALFNARRFEEARSVLLAGIAVYPESALFSRDSLLVEQALKM